MNDDMIKVDTSLPLKITKQVSSRAADTKYKQISLCKVLFCCCYAQKILSTAAATQTAITPKMKVSYSGLFKNRMSVLIGRVAALNHI